MGQHRDLKINYDYLCEINSIVKKYIDALEELQSETEAFVEIINNQEGDVFVELKNEYEDAIVVDYTDLIDILKEIYHVSGRYIEEMQYYISPENSSMLCRVDRNDIWWNLQQIKAIPYAYVEAYPHVPSHYYMDEFVNPFADDADEVRARNEDRRRRRENNYNKLVDFYNNTIRNTADGLWQDTEDLKSIYDNYVVEYENTDDIYASKMDELYDSIKTWIDIAGDLWEGTTDFLRGFGTGIVDLVKGLKAPLEIVLAISPTMPLPIGVRIAFLYDGGMEIYQGTKVFINDPENTIGAMFQGMFDTGDEEGTAFCVGYATEKVVEAIVAKKVADAMAGPKVDGKTPFRDLMTPDEAARYDEYWLKVAEKKVVPKAENKAAEIIRTQSRNEAGPCLSAIYDPELDKIFYGQNFKHTPKMKIQYEYWINNDADPIVNQRYLEYRNKIDSGKIILESHVDKWYASHSEIRALDEVLKARRKVGLPVTNAVIDELYVYNIDLWDARKINIFTPKCRCPNCKNLTNGINTLIHD
ncbi:MAG: hypothetical protein IIT65_03335 [Lachnospiraceae bacterium]|nr:hypothetical protein [Lachnospiraceae bacterium]